jgi:hypothetical protein
VGNSNHPVYVKRRFRVVSEEGESFHDFVVDVTDQYLHRDDRPLDREWTEVILIGKHMDQDTVADLLPDATRKNWLIRQINQRFYRFPQGVKVHNADASSGQKNTRKATGLEDVTLRHCQEELGGRCEDVSATHPVYGPATIRYCKLNGRWGADSQGESRAKTMEAYGIGSRGDHICLVWKDECYEVETGWTRISGPFGVTYGSANVAIEVLLPDTAPIKNNTYRDKLLRRDDSGSYVKLMEFADLVRASRPKWLIDYIEEEARQDNPSSNVMDRLRHFVEQLKVTGDRRQAVEGEGNDEGERPGSGGRHKGGKGGKDSDSENHRPARGRRSGQSASGIPEIRFTSDPAILAEMRGRAALYRQSENLVLLNKEHFRYQQDLERMLQDAGPDAVQQQLAQQLFDEEYMVQAGKYVVQAWIFRGRADWNDAEFEQALGMGAMTVHLATPATLAEARRKYRQRMNSNRLPSTSVTGEG